MSIDEREIARLRSAVAAARRELLLYAGEDPEDWDVGTRDAMAQMDATIVRFHTDAKCGACGGQLEIERKSICCRCTDAILNDLEETI